MKTITAIIAFLPAMAATCLAGILAGPITNPMNGHIYYLLSQNTWTESQVDAVQLGGNLATINDETEQNWVYQTFPGTNRNLWIGLADQNNVLGDSFPSPEDGLALPAAMPVPTVCGKTHLPLPMALASLPHDNRLKKES